MLGLLIALVFRRFLLKLLAYFFPLTGRLRMSISLHKKGGLYSPLIAASRLPDHSLA